MKAKVFSATVKGTTTQIKAFKKINAVDRFQQLDSAIKASNVYLSTSVNSHQAPVEELYPEICK